MATDHQPGDVFQQYRGGSLYYVRPDGTIDESRANCPVDGSPIRLVVRDGKLMDGWTGNEFVARTALFLTEKDWSLNG
jgi:hypothetical protein